MTPKNVGFSLSMSLFISFTVFKDRLLTFVGINVSRECAVASANALVALQNSLARLTQKRTDMSSSEGEDEPSSKSSAIELSTSEEEHPVAKRKKVAKDTSAGESVGSKKKKKSKKNVSFEQNDEGPLTKKTKRVEGRSVL